MKLRFSSLLLLTVYVLAACGSYRHNILFQVNPQEVASQTEQAQANYVIQPHDLLTLQVYTNNGEKIIDPNLESFGTDNSATGESSPLQYPVDINGMVKFPLLGKVRVEGLTLSAAEEMLGEAYNKFYEGAYVVLQFTNKRVIVLGAPGGQVIPLHQENIRLAEVLALAKGVTADGRGNNIRILRHDKVFVADFSTFDGYRTGNIVMQPGDVVYVEPVRRPFSEALRDYSPAITIITSLATLIFIISRGTN